MRHLWCRVFGHRWEDHHHAHMDGVCGGVVKWCPRCGQTKVTAAGEAAAAWRERRL